jgi:RHS repeat-associated protein
MTYDGENRLVSFCSSGSCTQFVYDAAGNRVQRTDQNGTTIFVYDAFGNLAAEYGGTASATGTQYVTVDAMGTTRLVMERTQASERHDFQPYEDEIAAGAGTWRPGVAGYGTDTVRQKGQERDAESGLDYFQARYYSGVQGRFGSPDPGNAGANPGDPQSVQMSKSLVRPYAGRVPASQQIFVIGADLHLCPCAMRR